MTYMEIVEKVREAFENADAREILEHVAVQVNIEGEGSGAFYIEVAERNICVEPYDYYDRDGLLTADAVTLLSIADGQLDLNAALENGAIRVEGNPDKLTLLKKIKFKEPKAVKKAAVKAEAAEKKPAVKKTAEKKPVEKKPAAKKAAVKAEAPKAVEVKAEAPKTAEAKAETKAEASKAAVKAKAPKAAKKAAPKK